MPRLYKYPDVYYAPIELPSAKDLPNVLYTKHSQAYYKIVHEIMARAAKGYKSLLMWDQLIRDLEDWELGEFWAKGYTVEYVQDKYVRDSCYYEFSWDSRHAVPDKSSTEAEPTPKKLPRPKWGIQTSTEQLWYNTPVGQNKMFYLLSVQTQKLNDYDSYVVNLIFWKCNFYFYLPLVDKLVRWVLEDKPTLNNKPDHD